MNNMKYVIAAIVAIIIIAGGAFAFSSMNAGRGVSEDSDPIISNPEEITAVASFYPLEFVLNRIGGDAVRVINIGEGQDPHDFRPSARDIQEMLGANLVAINGADLEPWGEEVKEQLEAAGVPVFVATENLDLIGSADEHDDHDQEKEEKEEDHDKHEHDHAHEHGDFDPHVWLSPTLLISITEQLQAQLSMIDQDNASLYESNAEELITELDKLDEEYLTALESCTLDEVITSHDAFGYLARAYGFEIHSIAGLSTQDTPSARTLADLKEEAAEGIGAILLEENSIAAFGETLARETGLQTLSISPISFNTPGEDYLSLMRVNLEIFTIALQCSNNE